MKSQGRAWRPAAPVVFHSQIATEENRFTIAEVIERISSKMIPPYPHVSAKTRLKLPRSAAQLEAIKAAELEAKGKASRRADARQRFQGSCRR